MSVFSLLLLAKQGEMGSLVSFLKKVGEGFSTLNSLWVYYLKALESGYCELLHQYNTFVEIS